MASFPVRNFDIWIYNIAHLLRQRSWSLPRHDRLSGLWCAVDVALHQMKPSSCKRGAGPGAWKIRRCAGYDTANRSELALGSYLTKNQSKSPPAERHLQATARRWDGSGWHLGQAAILLRARSI